MIQIAEKPYLKTFNFPIISDAGIFKHLLYLLAIIIPFFMVFSVRNFYLSSVDVVELSPTISYNYNYYIEIVTSKSTYTYTNLYTQTQRVQAFSLEYQYEPDKKIHTFGFQWAKSADEAVKKITIIPYFSYSSSGFTNAIGFAQGIAYGVNLADTGITGLLSIKQGNGKASPPTIDLLPSYQYNIGETLLGLENNYAAYLGSNSDYVATNMQNTLLSVSYRLNVVDYFVKEDIPNILGQLVWSFSQYFPVAFVLVLIVQFVIRLVFRQNIISTAIIHEKRIRN